MLNPTSCHDQVIILRMAGMRNVLSPFSHMHYFSVYLEICLSVGSPMFASKFLISFYMTVILASVFPYGF